MRLEEFMERVGADDEAVAAAIGRDRSTVSRIRREKVNPDAATLLKLNAWAEDAARKKRLPRRDRLSWDHLLGDDSPSNGAAA